MSISDVLFEAEKEIEQYLEDNMITGFVGYAEGTPELKAKVVELISAMSKLREELDEPPPALRERDLDILRDLGRVLINCPAMSAFGQTGH
jgi:hypothetical protein